MTDHPDVPAGKTIGLDGKIRPARRLDTTRRDANIIRLRTIEGLSYRAICEQLDVSYGTVQRVVERHRAAGDGSR